MAAQVEAMSEVVDKGRVGVSDRFEHGAEGREFEGAGHIPDLGRHAPPPCVQCRAMSPRLSAKMREDACNMCFHVLGRSQLETLLDGYAE